MYDFVSWELLHLVLGLMDFSQTRGVELVALKQCMLWDPSSTHVVFIL